MTVKFNAQLLSAVSPCISKEKTRYCLCGVFFISREGGGAYAAATDGHALAVAYDPNGIAPTNGVILPMSKDTLRECKPKRDDIVDRTFTWAENQSYVSFFERETFHISVCRPIDGTYPDWRRIVPSDLNAGHTDTVAFGAAQLKRLGDIAGLLGQKDTPIIVFSGSHNGPAIMRFGCNGDFFVVQMPMKAQEYDKALPDFYSIV